MNSNEFTKGIEKMREMGIPDLPGSPFDLEEVTLTVRLPRFIARIPEITSFLEGTGSSKIQCPVTFVSLVEESILKSLISDKDMMKAMLMAFTIWHMKAGEKGDKA